jgi:hypothetical protein
MPNFVFAKRASIADDDRRCRLREENRFANQPKRFAQKTGFGERRSAPKPVSMKIFSLPKIATQSPRNALSTDIREP